jgi:peptidyl-tRNA hydrolase
LTAGQQIAQISHAVSEFAKHRPIEFDSWYHSSQYIVALQAENLSQLIDLLSILKTKGFDTVYFCEPDFDNQLTAVAVTPHEDVKGHLANFPLAGKGYSL